MAPRRHKPTEVIFDQKHAIYLEYDIWALQKGNFYKGDSLITSGQVIWIGPHGDSLIFCAEGSKKSLAGTAKLVENDIDEWDYRILEGTELVVHADKADIYTCLVWKTPKQD